MNKYPIVVLGAGESGAGAASLARTEGYGVFVSDLGTIQPYYKSILQKRNIPYEENRHSPEIILYADEIIKSPGIPDNTPIVLEAKQKGIPVISEIEFAARFSNGRFICITGSNGKTTTALLTHHILSNGSIDAGLAGNVGKSFAMELLKGDHEWWVLEISSFQLDGMFKFKADIAILTNITPDHLDRYANFEEYTASKMRIIQNQGPTDAFIWFANDPVIWSEVDKRNLTQRIIPYGEKALGYDEECWIENNKIKIKINQYIMSITIENLALQGRHNTHNSMAAAVAAKLLDVRSRKIKESLSDFKNIEHRLEFVASVHGIDFINDSKATNVNSTWYALESMKKPVIWIAGGKDKGNDYSILIDLVKQKVKAIVCLGVDNSKIRRTFAGLVDTIVEAYSADQAVEAAYRLGQNGDVVLLSPACASFDLFENYEERGKKFKQAVKRL
ncbi:MAG TPA: UDP-N-acetylmuramoyl-L-alanine--D-glutamate ligase [Bacteroidales bacterium]|jgi:UDP-N-acetylmuramoylalanine--D-glutamate ligase|nr:UDP-N-acetylmuramoyl-L-alanine--D-glutamate ligase [Bacteroidales bacterium]MDI9574694.1 UDP-N-acetylmuramoyl-L-alanine--D-glutamate ligase [Bacteroidota bacterium]OQC60841.1 MAG: UDP-N-acetylmuramoylalanine--D-glutamate ligase [Bacteroidetes bacterium ADurb.Bin012]MBP9588366.1 UDP-N-acetylmuramoyl-L-alanine--D-glutamate ligase [Bacteroidales bacterium]NMD16893.1 UDP-N-acetylmuramoyl-L-alanine--D-glutamate ligase [Bacteroidales bacterium]